MIKLALARNYIIIATISLYLLLNRGFMLVRIPPVVGGGVPIGEIVLLLALATISNLKVLSRFSTLMAPFLVWWLYGISRAFYGASEHGMFALRDAVQIIESLFVIVGFAFASDYKMMERFYSWLPKLLFIICVYALGYPFMEELQSLSPTITAAAGYQTPILFVYVNTPQILLMSATYLVIFRNEVRLPGISILIAVLVLYPALLFQARTIYFQIISLFIVLVYYKKLSVNHWIFPPVIFVLMLGILSLSGIVIKGRLGEPISFEFLQQHFMAIAGIKSSVSSAHASLNGAAAGVSQRFGWWIDLYERLTSDLWTFLFGLGYGFPLINFKGLSNEIVREPHNSFISIFARLGLVGEMVFIWIHVNLFRHWNSAYKYFSKMNMPEWNNRLLILMVFFILVLVNCMGEDALEKPYFTIPYYFFWGIVIRIHWNIKRASYS